MALVAAAVVVDAAEAGDLAVGADDRAVVAEVALLPPRDQAAAECRVEEECRVAAPVPAVVPVPGVASQVVGHVLVGVLAVASPVVERDPEVVPAAAQVWVGLAALVAALGSVVVAPESAVVGSVLAGLVERVLVGLVERVLVGLVERVLVAVAPEPASVVSARVASESAVAPELVSALRLLVRVRWGLMEPRSVATAVTSGTSIPDWRPGGSAPRFDLSPGLPSEDMAGIPLSRCTTTMARRSSTRETPFT